MVIRAETYPGYGYQQQSYTMVHEGPYFSPPSQFSGVQVAPNPYTANPYPMPHAAYPQQPSGSWYNNNKHRSTGWQSPTQGGWTSDTNKHQSTTGWQSPAHGGWSTSDTNKYQSTGWQSPAHGGWNSDINKHQSSGWPSTAPGGWNSTGTDYYSHGANGQMSAHSYNNDGYNKVNVDNGYGSYPGEHFPAKTEYGSFGMQNGCQMAEWKLKNIDD